MWEMAVKRVVRIYRTTSRLNFSKGERPIHIKGIPQAKIRRHYQRSPSILLRRGDYYHCWCREEHVVVERRLYDVSSDNTGIDINNSITKWYGGDAEKESETGHDNGD
jgi:hypothetical protein